MTDFQKQQIHNMRGTGESYAQIAATLTLSVNTIKSYCRRNDLGGRARGMENCAETIAVCKQCGKPLMPIPGIKPRKFCSTLCRSAWWAAHPHDIKKRAIYSFTCLECGTDFTAYGNKGRKFCSHACYIKARFGGVRE